MTDDFGTYYPPRARWYSPLLSLGDAFRRRFLPRWLLNSKNMSFSGLAGSFFIPGLGFLLRDPRLYGPIALGAAVLLTLIFFMWLGFPAANWCLGLLLSLHACGIVFYAAPLMEGQPFRIRLVFTICVLAIIGGVLYMPAQELIERHWLLPLQVHGQQVMVVNRRAAMSEVKRGDVIAYELSGDTVTERAVVLQGGLAVGPVLAIAGDTIGFSETTFEVNGQARPRLNHMPMEGQTLVPEKSCFVWPDVGVSVRGQVPEANISAGMARVAIVNEKQYIGKPFQRWFWRRQL